MTRLSTKRRFFILVILTGFLVVSYIVQLHKNDRKYTPQLHQRQIANQSVPGRKGYVNERDGYVNERDEDINERKVQNGIQTNEQASSVTKELPAAMTSPDFSPNSRSEMDMKGEDFYAQNFKHYSCYNNTRKEVGKLIVCGDLDIAPDKVFFTTTYYSKNSLKVRIHVLTSVFTYNTYTFCFNFFINDKFMCDVDTQ